MKLCEFGVKSAKFEVGIGGAMGLGARIGAGGRHGETGGGRMFWLLVQEGIGGEPGGVGGISVSASPLGWCTRGGVGGIKTVTNKGFINFVFRFL